MTIQNKKQSTTSTAAVVDLFLENNPQVSNPLEFAKAFSNELKALAAAVRTDIPSYDLNKGYVDTVNVTINNFVKTRYGLTAERNSGDGYSLAQMYARVFSANAPKTNYDDVKNTVLPMLERGLWCLGAIPKTTTATTGRGKTSLPFDRLDIIAAMRAIVDGDEEGNAVVSEWTTLDDDSFLEAYTMESLEADSLISVAIEHLKSAQAAAIAAANEARLANLKGKKLSFKITPKA